MFARGLTDKEVASRLFKSYWTVKTQKRTIYEKLGISKDTELLWYMICQRIGIKFDLTKIRELGINIINNDADVTIQRIRSEAADYPSPDE